MLKWIPCLFGLLGAIAVGVWLHDGPSMAVVCREPEVTGDGAGAIRTDKKGPVGQLTPGTGKPAELPGDWPCFRNRQRDNISTDDVRLARSWPAGGPPVLWALDVGEGYAGAAVWSGRVFILDYDRERQSDVLRCLSLADGVEIWRYSYPVAVKRNHGMSRTVPAVTEKYVVSLGPKCHVTCLESTSGKFLWSKDLVAEFGTEVPQWWAGQCPLIEDDRAILAPGGDALLAAVDCATGQVVWRTPNPRGWKMSHVSVAPMSCEGKRVYVYSTSDGVAGVSGETGQVLWESDAWSLKVPVASPVPVDDERIFFCGGYAAGSMMLRLKAAAGKFATPEPVFSLKENVFGSAQHTPILYEERIYGVRPNGELVCLDLDGKVLWASGTAHRFGQYGYGPYLIADGLILVLDERGKLTLAEAGSSEFKLLAQAQVLPGNESWGPMALAGGRLIARDLTRMVCLDLAEAKK